MDIDVYEVVKKLIGEIEPVGETHTDGQRFKNLGEMATLIDQLVMDVHDVSVNKDRHEYSMNKSGKHADKYLRSLKDEIIEYGHVLEI